MATVPWNASVHKIVFTTDNQNHQQQILVVDYKDHRVVVANSTTKTTTGLILLDEETGHVVPLKDISNYSLSPITLLEGQVFDLCVTSNVLFAHYRDANEVVKMWELDWKDKQ